MMSATSGETQPQPRQSFAFLRGVKGRYLLLVLALSLVVRLLPAYFVYGSFDVSSWIMVVRNFRMHHNPYETGKLNWPPLWPILLLYMMRIEDVYSLEPSFSVKIIPCI